MVGMRLAAIDVGTQSVKLSVGDAMPDGGVHIVDRYRVPAQMPHCESGEDIAGVVIEQVAERVAEVCDRARAAGAVRIRVVGTSAPREAANSNALQRAITAACGVEFQLITGEEEARLVWSAVSAALAETESAALIDVGGGSTEVVTGCGADLSFATSMQMGAVRCADRFSLRDRASRQGRIELEQWVDQCLGRACVPENVHVNRVFATGGTVTVLTLLSQSGMPLPQDQSQAAKHVDGATLTAASISKRIESLVSMDCRQRSAETGLSPLRSEVIVPGAIILGRVLRWIGAEKCEVHEAGLRDGLLRRMAFEAM